MREVSVNAVKVLRTLASLELADQWVRSAKIAEEVGLDSARLTGALKLIRAESESMHLPSPVTFALKRKDGSQPTRHIKLSAEYADLVRQAADVPPVAISARPKPLRKATKKVQVRPAPSIRSARGEGARDE
jgi:hypothetical protein